MGTSKSTIVAWAHVAMLASALAASPAFGQAKPAAAAPAAAAKTAAPAKPAADPLRQLRKSYDKMLGMSWYEHPSSPKFINSSGFYVYFGRNDQGQYTDLRLVMRYFADDWLFVQRAWAKADGETVELPQKSGMLAGWERDNGDGDIWEWSDAPLVKPHQLAAVKKLAEAKSVVVRYEGQQYRKDRELTAQQRKAMREVIAAYEAATNPPAR